MFDREVVLERGYIHNEVGGELQTYPLQKGGDVVAGRFGMQMNPNDPDEIYVGDLPRVRDKAIVHGESP